MQGKKLPETLRRKSVTFSEIADDGIAYIEAQYSHPNTDRERMKVLKRRFSGSADAITPGQIQNVLDSLMMENR